MSDIFNEYAKIAIEKNLISEAIDEETNPRYDTKTLSDIELLYGIKPNGDNDDIQEKAHPEPMSISDTYDRANGFGKTPKQNQSIGVGIAKKPNTGLLDHHRYVEAHKKLLNEVIKTAFWADKNNELELMALADSCAERLAKMADDQGGGIGAAGLGVGAIGLGGTVGALVGGTASGIALAPAVAVTGAVIGIAAAIHYFSKSSTEGLQKDVERTLNQIKDLSAQEKEHLSSFIGLLQQLKSSSTEYANISRNVSKLLLSISSAVSEQEKNTAIAQNAVAFLNTNQDKEIIEKGKKLFDLANAVNVSAPQVLQLVKDWDQKATSEYSVVKLYREYIYSTDYKDVIEELEILIKTCGGVPKQVTDVAVAINKLREIASSAISFKSKDEKQISPSEAPKKEEKPAFKLPDWA